MTRKFSDQQIQDFAEAALRDGFCVLPAKFSVEKIDQWREACLPLLDKQVDLEGGKTSRGSSRYYVTFPFSAPFNDPQIYEDPDILAILDKLVGKDFVMC